MSNASSPYSARIAYPDYVVRAADQTFSLELYSNGALSAPTQAGSTFALYSASGAAIIGPAAVTVASSIATYPALAAALPATLAYGHGYYQVWSLVCADGVTRPFRRDAALVQYAAYPVATDADLLAVYSDLGRQLQSGVTHFQTRLDEAWKRILGRLESQGVFPDHVVSSWSLREVHVELALHLVCLDCHAKQGSRWGELAAQHKKEFEMAWSRLRFVKGTSTTGAADSNAQRAANKGVIYVNASPQASWRGFGGL